MCVILRSAQISSSASFSFLHSTEAIGVEHVVDQSRGSEYNGDRMTQRVAFTMKLKPNVMDEYKRRHDEIWPELLALLRKHGISDYSIFLDESTSTLFAVQSISSTTASTSSNDSLRQDEIMQRWWIHMADLMETNADRSPITHPLQLVFHMD